MDSSKGKFDSVRDVPIEEASFGRVLPRQVSTGSLRGTQTVGYGSTKIDGSNNRIVITNPVDGTSIGMGTIPGSTTGEFGFFSLNESGDVAMTIINGAWSLFDTESRRSAYFGYASGVTEPVVVVMKEGYDALESISS